MRTRLEDLLDRIEELERIISGMGGEVPPNTLTSVEDTVVLTDTITFKD